MHFLGVDCFLIITFSLFCFWLNAYFTTHFLKFAVFVNEVSASGCISRLEFHDFKKKVTSLIHRHVGYWRRRIRNKMLSIDGNYVTIAFNCNYPWKIWHTRFFLGNLGLSKSLPFWSPIFCQTLQRLPEFFLGSNPRIIEAGKIIAVRLCGFATTFM